MSAYQYNCNERVVIRPNFQRDFEINVSLITTDG